MSGDERLRAAILLLHREKDAAYHDAWKKRGEVLSILANIARKVDRLEYVLDDGATIASESLFDTGVDLFVYCCKYQTYLADSDAAAAETLFSGSDISRPYSSGVAGFEHLISRVDLAGLYAGDMGMADAASRVLTCFGELESCFDGISTQRSAVVRVARVQNLADAALHFLGALKRLEPILYSEFLAAHGREEGAN